MQRPDAPSGVDEVLLEYGASTDNTQAQIGFEENGKVTVMWEHSGGTATGTATDVFWDTNAQSRHHLAIVKKDAGGGNHEVEYYRDGILTETLIDSAPGPDGGDDSAMRLYVARGVSGQQYKGRIDDMRLSSVARTPTEIQTSY